MRRRALKASFKSSFCRVLCNLELMTAFSSNFSFLMPRIRVAATALPTTQWAEPIMVSSFPASRQLAASPCWMDSLQSKGNSSLPGGLPFQPHYTSRQCGFRSTQEHKPPVGALIFSQHTSIDLSLRCKAGPNYGKINYKIVSVLKEFKV